MPVENSLGAFPPRVSLPSNNHRRQQGSRRRRSSNRRHRTASEQTSQSLDQNHTEPGTNLGVEDYPCNFCGNTFEELTELAQHVQSAHPRSTRRGRRQRTRTNNNTNTNTRRNERTEFPQISTGSESSANSSGSNECESTTESTSLDRTESPQFSAGTESSANSSGSNECESASESTSSDGTKSPQLSAGSESTANSSGSDECKSTTESTSSDRTESPQLSSGTESSANSSRSNECESTTESTSSGRTKSPQLSTGSESSASSSGSNQCESTTESTSSDRTEPQLTSADLDGEIDYTTNFVPFRFRHRVSPCQSTVGDRILTGIECRRNPRTGTLEFSTPVASNPHEPSPYIAGPPLAPRPHPRLRPPPPCYFLPTIECDELWPPEKLPPSKQWDLTAPKAEEINEADVHPRLAKLLEEIDWQLKWENFWRPCPTFKG